MSLADTNQEKVRKAVVHLRDRLLRHSDPTPILPSDWNLQRYFLEAVEILQGES